MSGLISIKEGKKTAAWNPWGVSSKEGKGAWQSSGKTRKRQTLSDTPAFPHRPCAAPNRRLFFFSVVFFNWICPGQNTINRCISMDTYNSQSPGVRWLVLDMQPALLLFSAFYAPASPLWLAVVSVWRCGWAADVTSYLLSEVGGFQFIACQVTCFCYLRTARHYTPPSDHARLVQPQHGQFFRREPWAGYHDYLPIT